MPTGIFGVVLGNGSESQWAFIRSHSDDRAQSPVNECFGLIASTGLQLALWQDRRILIQFDRPHYGLHSRDCYFLVGVLTCSGVAKARRK